MTDRNEALRLADSIHEMNNAAYMTAIANLNEKNRQQAEQLDAELCNREVLDKMLNQCIAERDQLRAEVERLRVDAERLDWLESEADDLRTVTSGEDDYDWIVISHHMAKPHEREVGRAKTARDAIDAARTTHKETE